MRYFLHIRNGEILIADLEGAEFSDFESARREAVKSARELLADTLRRGEIVNGRAIEICTEDGRVVDIVYLKDQFRLP